MKLTNKLCLTSGGKCNTTDTIYAAEFTKHDLIYVGQSSQSGRVEDSTVTALMSKLKKVKIVK